MRYNVYRFTSPTDPRHRHADSLDTLFQGMDSFGRFHDELDAVEAVRGVYPDAVAMPVILEVGSGSVMVLGLLESSSVPTDPSGRIPFVMLVQAVGDNGNDRMRMRKQQQFTERLWQAPVADPKTDIDFYKVEVRATDLRASASVPAAVGRDMSGRLVIRVEVGGVSMSMTFDDPRATLSRTPSASSSGEPDAFDAAATTTCPKPPNQ
jgi:hypothetical protein